MAIITTAAPVSFTNISVVGFGSPVVTDLQALNNELILAFSKHVCIGDLFYMIGLDIDSNIVKNPATIKVITLLCPQSASSGVITVDLLRLNSPGVGPPTTLFTSVPKPTLTCNGGYVWAAFSGGALPDIVNLAANSLLVARIVSAPQECYDLTVLVY